MKEISLPYVAGFFDGEGCITFSQIKKYNPVMKKRYPCTTIRMELTNTDMRIIKRIYKFFNIGHLIPIKPRKEGYKPQLRWQLTHRQAQKVIKKILPYMFEKNKILKAKKVLRYYEKRDSNK
tara:strand:- start:729 stop:1094 length:366 start_codon:yes stop_codon:yes gene_type:complete